jgi:hypothetical protein
LPKANITELFFPSEVILRCITIKCNNHWSSWQRRQSSNPDLNTSYHRLRLRLTINHTTSNRTNQV